MHALFFELPVDFLGHFAVALATLVGPGVALAILLFFFVLGLLRLGASSFLALRALAAGRLPIHSALALGPVVGRAVFNVVLKSILEFLEGGVALGFNFLELLGDQTIAFLFVFDALVAVLVVEQIGAADVEDQAVVGLFVEERVVDETDAVLGLHFLEVLLDLLAQSEAFLLLAHGFVDLGHVLSRALLLRLFGHAEYFLIAFAHVLDEGRTVADEGALNGVDEGAGALVESVGATNLNGYSIDLLSRGNLATRSGA